MIIRRWGGSQTTTRVGSTLNGNILVQAVNTDGLVVGTAVSGSGIPAGATVASIVGATSFNLSAAATASGTPTLTFSGLFFTEHPRTTAQSIRNDSNTANIFDSNDKLLPAYLPNSVFDSLRFFATVGVNSDLRNLGLAAVANATAANRSAIGYYWVATAAVNAGSGTGTIDVSGVFAQTSGFNAGEERFPGSQLSVDLEVGDWFILTSISGAGTSGSPYTFTYAAVNNTYEVMGGAGASTAGYQGLVPGPGSGQNFHFLRGDGTWVVPTNTTYTGSTSVTLNGTSFERAALTGDVTASGNSNATTIAADAVTFAKMQNIATSTILGRVTAGTADIEALTPAQVRTLINVADGAQVNVATNIAQGTRTTTAVPVTSSTGTGATLDIATTLLAGVMSSADKTKLDGIATSATANSSDATLLARGNHTGTQTAATISDFATAVAATASVTANTAKVTNASHTGDVTGSSALTIANLAVTYAKIQNISATSRILGRITAGAGSTEELTGSNVRSIIELAAPIYIQTATPTATVTNALWYDIN